MNVPCYIKQFNDRNVEVENDDGELCGQDIFQEEMKYIKMMEFQ